MNCITKNKQVIPISKKYKNDFIEKIVRQMWNKFETKMRQIWNKFETNYFVKCIKIDVGEEDEMFEMSKWRCSIFFENNGRIYCRKCIAFSTKTVNLKSVKNEKKIYLSFKIIH